jgi:hypothetical protein
MKPPAAVQRYMREFDETAHGTAAYIRSQLEFYATLPRGRAATPAQWIALKLGCSAAQAPRAIDWARRTR